MDMTDTIVPKSDQLNAEDFLAGSHTFTIKSVTAGSTEQPININLIEAPGRAYRPSKSMRRILVAAWGVEASTYTGRRLTLFRDPTIKFGGIEVGGIVISHLSHIDKPLTIALTVTRGKRAPHNVEPLVESAPAPTQSEPTAKAVAACTDPDALRVMWHPSGPERRAQIEERVKELTVADTDDSNAPWTDPK